MIRKTILAAFTLIGMQCYASEKLNLQYQWQLTGLSEKHNHKIEKSIDTQIANNQRITFDAQPFKLDISIKTLSDKNFKLNLELLEYGEGNDASRIIQRQQLQKTGRLNQEQSIMFIFGDYQFDSRINAGTL